MLPLFQKNFVYLHMPRFLSTITGFFGLSFLKPKNPKGRKLQDNKNQLCSCKDSRITDIMLMSVSRVLRSALSWGKVGGHGVERAIGRERNKVEDYDR